MRKKTWQNFQVYIPPYMGVGVYYTSNTQRRTQRSRLRHQAAADWGRQTEGNSDCARTGDGRDQADRVRTQSLEVTRRPQSCRRHQETTPRRARERQRETVDKARSLCSRGRSPQGRTRPDACESGRQSRQAEGGAGDDQRAAQSYRRAREQTSERRKQRHSRSIAGARTWEPEFEVALGNWREGSNDARSQRSSQVSEGETRWN